ncbi:MAG: hypothetical protein LBT21_07430 [Oscillospiraceae bacterium]|jgi:hypothetical protein|nr:hypothetical protein [Oscillospiraceae bacterium]
MKPRVLNKILTPDTVYRLKKLRPYVLVFCVLFAFVMALSSTLAWFTVSDTVQNNMTAEKGDFSAVVVDVFTTPDDPTVPFPKRVGAVNLGSTAAFVRVLLLPTIIAPGGTILPAAFGSEIHFVDLNTTDFVSWPADGKDWAYGGDGYYYYLHVLEPKNSTDDGSTPDPELTFLNTNLFNTLRLVDNLGVEYDNATIKVEVKCEALDTNKWSYREGWWGLTGASPVIPANYTNIDNALNALAHAA